VSAHTPHPEHELAGRIDALKAANPDVQFRSPLESASGKWEAEGKTWLIMEGSAARFCDLLAEALK
jgi:hypothetical protein